MLRHQGHARSVSDVGISIREELSTDKDSDSGSEGQLSPDKFPLKEGTLSKWTNYVNGWQDRHVVVRDGTLSYYRSADEADICRAAVDLAAASVQRHKFDHFRFDVRCGDQCFYFRATTEAEKDR
jgi:collagen type IV alpha-3-binding protein